MSHLLFRCPRTGDYVESPIEAERNLLLLARLYSVRLRCPFCEGMHEWTLAQGRVARSAAPSATSSFPPG